MKKFTVILFTLFYLISSSGVAVSSFYCCGKYKETFIFKSNHLANFCKGNKKIPGCCDTKTVLVKVKDNFSPSHKIKFSHNDFSVQLFTVAPIFIQPFNNVDESVLFALIHAPPLISKQPVYLSVCNFRI